MARMQSYRADITKMASHREMCVRDRICNFMSFLHSWNLHLVRLDNLYCDLEYKVNKPMHQELTQLPWLIQFDKRPALE